MPLVATSRIIVLHLTKYGESGLIVHAIDRDCGRTSLFLKGAGRGRNASATALLHPLSVHQAVTVTSTAGSLPYLREYTPCRTLASLRTDIVKSSIALFISEILYRSIHESDTDTQLFDWLEDAIVMLDALDEGAANFHLWFLTGLAVRTGFRPEDNYSPERPLFDPQAARFVEAGPWRDATDLFSEAHSLLLHQSLSLQPAEFMALRLASTTRRSFAELMIRYLSWHWGIQPQIKSLDVLHAVFN